MKLTERITQVVHRRAGRRRASGEIRFRCPAHDDRNPSADWNEEKGVWICRACGAKGGTHDLAQRLGLSLDRRKVGETEYRVRDTDGRVVATHVRIDRDGSPKRVFWRPKLNGRRVDSLPLYGVHELPRLGPVIVVEGEPARDALKSIGVPSVGTVTGADEKGRAPGPDALRPLLGRCIFVWPDADPPGASHMSALASRLYKLGAERVRRIEWLAAPEKGDAVDYLEGGGTADGVRGLMAVAPVMPREVAHASDSDGRGQVEAQPADSASTRKFQRTDLGNVERFVARHGADVRHCFANGCFYVWSGRRWEVDETGAVMRMAGKTARSIYAEAEHGDSPEEAEDIAKWATRSESRTRLEAMVFLARSCSGIAVKARDLDTDPWLLNCLNGTIDLRTGTLREHRRQDLITKLAPVRFDPAAQCPRFGRFLKTTFRNDAELIRFVLRLLGMSLTGDAREQILAIFYGDGNNGKSVLLDTVCGAMGDYAAEAPPDLLASRRGERHPTELADLMGRRLVVASEVEEGSVMRLQLVKRLTGNARIKARFMRQDFFEFPRTHKLILVTNNKPIVRENTEAAWRRLRLVPFTHVVPKAKRDKELLQKLEKEWPGILAKLVRGCLEWQREGLGEPDPVLVATEDYRMESDDIARFVTECCVTAPDTWAASSELRVEYEKWCQDRGSRPVVGNAFTDRLRARGFLPKKQCGARGWQGIGLCAE